MKQVAEYLGVAAGTLSRYHLPDADAWIDDTRGWNPATIKKWHAERPSSRGLMPRGPYPKKE